MEFRIGAVDRGACVRDLSQYQAETEHLFVPCSWVEQSGEVACVATPSGVVQMIPCGLRANLKAATTEELHGRRRRMHLAAFRFRLDELPGRLAVLARDGGAEARLAADPTLCCEAGGRRANVPQWTVDGLIGRIVEQAGEVLRAHEKLDTAAYVDEARYRGLLRGMAEVFDMAGSKLLGWLEDPACRIAFQHGKALRVTHRQRIAFLMRTLPAEGPSRRAAAEKLCRVRGLIDATADELNELGETSLAAAAAEGRAAGDLAMLAGAGADVNARDGDGLTALHAAAAGGHTACVAALAALGADLDVPGGPRGVTPIFRAAWAGQAECVRRLAEARADVNRVNAYGFTPVYIAAQMGHADCIRALAAAAADVRLASKDGQTPLWSAADEGRVECLRALRALGAGADAATECLGRTPLRVAEEKGHAACVEELRAWACAEEQGDAACVGELRAWACAEEQGGAACVEELRAWAWSVPPRLQR